VSRMTHPCGNLHRAGLTGRQFGRRGIDSLLAT